MTRSTLPAGTVHKLPSDMRKTIVASARMRATWEDITPLARNEFICWIEDAKKEETRERRLRIAKEKLEYGERRPCCWAGCSHREKNNP